MNINDLGAMIVSSVGRRPFYKILLGNYRGNLCPHIFSQILMAWVLWPFIAPHRTAPIASVVRVL